MAFQGIQTLQATLIYLPLSQHAMCFGKHFFLCQLVDRSSLRTSSQGCRAVAVMEIDEQNSDFVEERFATVTETA